MIAAVGIQLFSLYLPTFSLQYLTPESHIKVMY